LAGVLAALAAAVTAVRAGRIAVVVAALAAACGNDQTAAPDASDQAAVDDGDPTTCGELPTDGICAGPSELERCVDGVVEAETCASACIVVGGVAMCAASDACSAVGPLGRCDGDALWRCDGAPSVTDCAAQGASCAYRDDTHGYGCVTGGLSARRVEGTIRWEDRAVSPGALGEPVPHPARGTMVAVVDETNTLISTVSAADDGSYVIHYDAPAGAMVRIVAYSRSRSPQRPARVRDTAGYLHAVGSAPFAAATTATVDLLITASSTTGAAWNVLDNAVTAMDWLRAHGVATVSPVIMYWQQTTHGGSYYQGGTNSLYLDGGDGFDDVVALHELGHYVQDEYSDSDSPGGSHDGSPADPRLAWGEGSATWFALAVRGVPYYIDYSAGGGWHVELENRVHKASMAGAMSQNVSEWMVAELMWDLTDEVGEDPVAGSVAAVWDVLVGYIMSAQRVDRGRAGMDLVELLDGWFDHHGMTSCSQLRPLVREKYFFPYDFAGPAGTCP
jgi:hypothetical protein